jgi:hypothetical protein
MKLYKVCMKEWTVREVECVEFRDGTPDSEGEFIFSYSHFRGIGEAWSELMALIHGLLRREQRCLAEARERVDEKTVNVEALLRALATANENRRRAGFAVDAHESVAGAQGRADHMKDA